MDWSWALDCDFFFYALHIASLSESGKAEKKLSKARAFPTDNLSCVINFPGQCYFYAKAIRIMIGMLQLLKRNSIYWLC